LGTLGLGSLITEITANEDDEKEDSKDSGNVDSEGEILYIYIYSGTLYEYGQEQISVIFSVFCLVQVG